MPTRVLVSPSLDGRGKREGDPSPCPSPTRGEGTIIGRAPCPTKLLLFNKKLDFSRSLKYDEN
jgi:hypothetical protein